MAGIYVRDTKSGSVRSVIGQTYMLKSSEQVCLFVCILAFVDIAFIAFVCQLWEKDLPDEVEELLDWSYYRGLTDDKVLKFQFSL